MRGQIALQFLTGLKITRDAKHLLTIGCLKRKKKILWNGNMFLTKENRGCESDCCLCAELSCLR